MQDNWDDLRLFLAVARHQGLTGAGRQMRRDPATMGRRVARLEERLGLTLFRKSARGYELTDEGQRLFELAERAETEMRAAFAEAASAPSMLTGQIRIGAPDGCANYLLPQVCIQIAKTYPGLDLHIVALPRVFNLSRREADLAIGVSAPDAASLLVERIVDYRLHLAAARSYLDGTDPINALADLKAHRIVGYIPDMIFDRELDYLAALKVDRVPLASNSVAVQLNILRKGGGVGFVHDFALSAAPDLVKVLPDALSLSRAFYLIRHKADRADTRLAKVAAALSEGLRQEVTKLEAQT